MAFVNRSQSLVLVAGSGRSGTALMALVRDAPAARIRNVHGLVDPSPRRSQPDRGDATPAARLRAAVRRAKSPAARLLSPLRRLPLPIRHALPLRGRIAIARALRGLEPRRLVGP
jgi:hypothetical protein